MWHAWIKIRIHIGFWLGKLEEGDQLQNADTGERIILKRILTRMGRSRVGSSGAR